LDKNQDSLLERLKIEKLVLEDFTFEIAEQVSVEENLQTMITPTEDSLEKINQASLFVAVHILILGYFFSYLKLQYCRKRKNLVKEKQNTNSNNNNNNNNNNKSQVEEREIEELTFQEYIRSKLGLENSSISDKSIENYILFYCLYCKLPFVLLLLLIPNDEHTFSCAYFYKHGRQILSHLKNE